MSTKNKSDGKNFTRVERAIACISSAMRRNKLTIDHMAAAVGILVGRAKVEFILNSRQKGLSIRAIARAVHMDDGRVSQIIKAEKSKPCCGKQCKPCKPAKQYAPCKKFEPCKPCKR